MNEPQLNRKDLKKLITISLLLKKLTEAFTQLSDDTKRCLNSESIKMHSNLKAIAQHIDYAILELKKPEEDDYKYQKYRKSEEFHKQRLDKHKFKQKLK